MLYRATERVTQKYLPVTGVGTPCFVYRGGMSTDTTPQREPRAQSLNTVREIIPADCYERPAAPAIRALVRAWGVYAVTFVALAMVHSWWAVGLLWIAAGFAVAGLFVLGHDASHGALTSSNKVNRVLARLCMIPSGHVEAAWDLGHNRIHHGYTTRQGFDFVWHPSTPEDYRNLGRIARLQHRIEWSWIGSGVYYLRTVWWQKMWRFNGQSKHRGQIIRDKISLGTIIGLAVAALVVVGALQNGFIGAVWLPVKLLVVPFLLFVHIIGWTVYVHHVDPSIKWWTRKDWSQYKGQMESTTVLEMPRFINWLWFHNIFVHVPHHVDVRIPFHKLPAAARAIEAAYPDTVRRARLSFVNYLRAARQCKLYDFENSRWLPYSAART